MKVISLLLFLFTFKAYACELKKPTYSLSGPITMILEELDLLNDKNLKAISVFHPVKDYQGKRLGGGIFLSAKILKSLNSSVVFFDKSEELKRSLGKHKKLKLVEVNTRSMSAYKATIVSIEKIWSHLKNCSKKVEALEENVFQLWKEVEKNNFEPSHNKLIFFIDEISSIKKLPRTAIVNDGVPKSFLVKKKIKTYKTPLEYVNWSSKMMNKQYIKYKKIGLVDAKDEKLRIQQLDSLHYNLYYRGALTPGIRQLRLASELIKKW